jgi:predicted RNA-binding Zn-ribbon protein involved in translation (DUF1610 family)
MLKKPAKPASHVALPKETRAFLCAECGAVSLDPQKICKVQGQGTKADWCGVPDNNPPRQCRNRVHNLRWSCANCNKVSVNAELLCEPRKMPEPPV